MSAATTASQVRLATFYRDGRRPEEQGYRFASGSSITLSDISQARSFVELINKGVPESVCLAARKAGYMPAELDDFIDS
jgi:hypothetical protein